MCFLATIKRNKKERRNKHKMMREKDKEGAMPKKSERKEQR